MPWKAEEMSREKSTALSFQVAKVYAVYQELLMRLLRKYGLARTLRPGMGNALFALFERDGRTMTELAEVLQLPRTTVTGVVERLAAARLVRSETAREDGRVRRIFLTARGRQLQPRCEALSAELNGHMARELSARERATLDHGLERIHECMLRALDGLEEGSSRNRPRARAR
jgi:DNA-binding MarR family transcriptional regulator